MNTTRATKLPVAIFTLTMTLGLLGASAAGANPPRQVSAPVPPPVPPVPLPPSPPSLLDDLPGDSFDDAIRRLDLSRERMQKQLAKVRRFKSHDERDDVLGGDSLAAHLFPPELIMGQQEALGLDDKSRAAIVEEVQRFQSTVVKTEWDMKSAAQKLAKHLQAAKVDEQEALALSDKLMGLERELKKAHLTMLVRIKNKLTAEQQEKLRQARRDASPFEVFSFSTTP